MTFTWLTLTATIYATSVGATGSNTINYASVTAGASFFSASSASEVAQSQGTVGIMESDAVNPDGTPWYTPTRETRYTFSSTDASQSIIVELANVEAVDNFSASYDYSDRSISSFSVETSIDGSLYLPVSGLAAGGTGTDDIKASSPVDAKYIEFFFGPASQQYPGSGGSAVTELVASSGVSDAPEPGTWALMFAGLGVIGAGLRLRRRRALDPSLA